MKKTEATKVKGIVQAWIKNRKKQFKGYESEYMAFVDVVESDTSKGHFGINIRTDSMAYDDIYMEESSGYYTTKQQQNLQKHINQKMGWKKDEHYFEPYGQGILQLY